MAIQVDVEELKKALLNKGVAPDVVNDAVKVSTFPKPVYACPAALYAMLEPRTKPAQRPTRRQLWPK